MIHRAIGHLQLSFATFVVSKFEHSYIRGPVSSASRSLHRSGIYARARSYGNLTHFATRARICHSTISTKQSGALAIQCNPPTALYKLITLSGNARRSQRGDQAGYRGRYTYIDIDIDIDIDIEIDIEIEIEIEI